MSSKSAAQAPVHDHTLLARNFIITTALAILAVYFLTVTLYPLIVPTPAQ